MSPTNSACRRGDSVTSRRAFLRQSSSVLAGGALTAAIRARVYAAGDETLIRNDKPHNEAEYTALSTMTAILGRMATYSGQVIRWDEAINSSQSLAPAEYAWDAAPPVVADADGVYPCAMPGVTKVL